jgi:hypothetical protein
MNLQQYLKKGNTDQPLIPHIITYPLYYVGVQQL